MDLKRNTAMEKFLGPGTKRVPLAGDASFRRYERVSIKGKTYVLMDAPPKHEDCRPFAALSGYLNSKGFSAPKVLKGDIEKGFLLLEDLGDETFNLIMQKDIGREPALYSAAVEVLAKLHKSPPPQTMPVPRAKPFTLLPYDPEHLFEELFLFADWYLPALVGKKNPAWREAMTDLWQPLFDKVAKENSVLTLKDYHADNLMWLGQRKGIKRVGLLDFQDARLGHPAYDLVSLLQDARRPYNPVLEAEMVAFYGQKTGQKGKRFLAAYQILGAQRNTKIIGIFTRLWQRDNKPGYPKMIPHVWRLLEENLKHPALSEIKAWVDRTVPKRLRGTLLT